ncbi:MAG: hypothetical protein ACXWJ5_12390 [Xanthobacteraceae bacterium]
MIDQVPLTRAISSEPLVVNNELVQELALSRAIRTFNGTSRSIRRCRWRSSGALTSVELAAYAEKSVQQPNLAAGQFSGMSIDVFGRACPDQKFFLVDRDAVTRYKASVHPNVAKVGARIGSIVRNVAVAA